MPAIGGAITSVVFVPAVKRWRIRRVVERRARPIVKNESVLLRDRPGRAGSQPRPPLAMLDLLAVAWLALSLVVLVATRANRYLVLGALGSTVLGCYFVAGAWMQGALSIASDEPSAQQHLRAVTMFELLAAFAMAAAAGFLVLAWRRRPRRRAVQQTQSSVQNSTP